MDVEAVRLVLNDGSAGIVTLAVVDALPFSKLEGLLELCHVLRHEQRSREWQDRPPQ